MLEEKVAGGEMETEEVAAMEAPAEGVVASARRTQGRTQR
jgi:hypothetical protein